MVRFPAAPHHERRAAARDAVATARPADGGCRHAPEPAAGPRVNGVRVDPMRLSELAPRVGELVDCGRSHVVHFVCADPTVVARRDAEYRAILNRGELNLPDGLPVAWVLRRRGHVTDRVTGTDGLLHLCDRGRTRGLRHFLYGGEPAVLRDLQSQLERAYPGVEVVGAIAPPFRTLGHDELARDAAAIRDAGADLVWVGLGTPKQDLVAERLRLLSAAPAILCVGAAFDFVAGTKRRAPGWMQHAGLEWLFRLGAEPRRLWRRYLIGNVRFVTGVAGESVRRRGEAVAAR